MGPSYMQSVINWNVIMRRIPVLGRYHVQISTGAPNILTDEFQDMAPSSLTEMLGNKL
jgi:hypothetical protein